MALQAMPDKGRVRDLVKELTSDEACFPESAMQGHSQFAEHLWDRTAQILTRVANGLESTEQLSDFIKGRQKAEEESAKQMRMMCMTTGALGSVLGSVGNRLGGSRLLGSTELDEALHESASSVRTAWSSLIYETKATANAHSDLANALHTELIEPLEFFHETKEVLLKQLAEEGRELHKQLVEAEDNVKSAQQKYYATEWQSDPASSSNAREAAAKSLRTSSTPSVSELTPANMYRNYEETVQESNGVQNSILRTKGLRTVLARLEQLEHQRIVLTKEAMSHFINLTANWLPARTGPSVAEEIAPTIDAIDPNKSIVSFCEKNVSGKLPGSLKTVEYDPVRDIPPSRKSLKQLDESGGGPILSGWTYKEGHLVRNWKKRWCVLWPVNFKEEAVTGPSLYYFDDNETTSCPKGTLPIFGATVRIPKKERKGHPWLVRIEDSKAGDGDEVTKHDKLVFAVDSQEERDEWLEVLGNASRGETVQRNVTFGKALVDIVKDQKKRRPDSIIDVPAIFMDVLHQLGQMKCFTVEGLFRVPGDSDHVQELRCRYELDEYCSRDFVDGAPKKARLQAAYEVHVWGSFLKAWIRSLKDPIITEDLYDEAIQIVDTDADVVAKLQGFLAKLPSTHAALVHHLTAFLSKVDPEESKMNAENLAIVFAPCLLRHADLMIALANSSKEIAFTKLLIENGVNLGASSAVEQEQAAFAAELEVKLAEAAAANSAAAAEAAANAEAEATDLELRLGASASDLESARLRTESSGMDMIEELNPAAEVKEPEPEPEPEPEAQPEPDPEPEPAEPEPAEPEPEPNAEPEAKPKPEAEVQQAEEGVPPDGTK